eukprot:gene1502-2135_t
MTSTETGRVLLWGSLFLGTVLVCEFCYRAPVLIAALYALSLVVLPVSYFVFDTDAFWEYESGSRDWWLIYIKQWFVIGLIGVPVLLVYSRLKARMSAELSSNKSIARKNFGVGKRALHIDLPKTGHAITIILCVNIAWTLSVDWSRGDNCAAIRSATAVQLILSLLIRSFLEYRASCPLAGVVFLEFEQLTDLKSTTKFIYTALTPTWCVTYLWWNVLFSVANYSARSAYHNVSVVFAIVYDLTRHDRVRGWSSIAHGRVVPPEQTFLWWRAVTLSAYLSTSAYLGVFSYFRRADAEDDSDDSLEECTTATVAYTLFAFLFLFILDTFYGGRCRTDRNVGMAPLHDQKPSQPR